jgi:outer membrane protein assembly factor BamA
MLFLKTQFGIFLSIILLLSISFFLTPFINAQVINPKILIQGNTRTTTSYLNSIVENCLENQKTAASVPIDRQEIQRCVLNTKLFSKVEVTYDHDVLTVDIQDRWTLIPVPIIVSEKGKETSYGALVMESNFLGSGKKLVAGGTVSKTNNFFILMFEDPSVFFSKWNMKLMAGQSHKLLESYEEEDIVDGIEIDSKFYSTNLGYRFNSHFKSTFQLSYHQFNYDNLEAYETPKAVTITSAGLTGKVDYSNFRFYFQEGVTAEFKYQENFNRTDDADFTKKFEFKLSWQLEAFNNQALQFGLYGGNILNADRRSAMRIGSKLGFRGIPGEGAWTDAYYAMSTDYQIPLSSSDKGTWTLAPFLDNGFLIQQTDHKPVSYLSYGIGSYFFLNKIAIPGIGLIIGTNTEYQDTFFKFTIGFNI